MIEDLMGGDVPEVRAFDWLNMDKWRTRKGVRPGDLGVELSRDRAVSSTGRFAPFPPRLVLAVDNGRVRFDDGREVAAELAETYIPRAGDPYTQPHHQK